MGEIFGSRAIEETLVLDSLDCGVVGVFEDAAFLAVCFDKFMVAG